MTKEQKIIKAKAGLLELAKQLGNVSQACKMIRRWSKRSSASLAEIGSGARRRVRSQHLKENDTPPDEGA